MATPHPHRASPVSSRTGESHVNRGASRRPDVLSFEHYRPESPPSTRVAEFRQLATQLGARCRLRRGPSVPYADRMNDRRNALHAQLDQLGAAGGRRPAEGGET